MQTRWVFPATAVVLVLGLVSARPASAQGMDGMDWVIKGQKGTAETKTVVPNTLTPRERKSGWTLLWDGTSLDGWHSVGGNPIVGWEIANGELISPGAKKAYSLVTDAEYENFELVAEWMVTPGADSGICYLVVEQGVERMESTGPEYQLAHDGESSEAGDHRLISGAVYGLLGPKKAESAFLGQWNVTRIVVNKGRVQHWLNGEKVVQYEPGSPAWQKLKTEGPWKDAAGYAASRRGRIGLQAGEGEVRFRSLKIRALPSAS